MKIIYFGIDVYLSCFEWLLQSEHEVIALYTYHEPKEYIRDEKICALAKKHNIPIHHDRISYDEVENLFKNKQCDLLLSAEYDAKIPVLNCVNFYGVNFHNSLLPEGKGYFPIEVRLFKGYVYGGITLHKLAERFDTGDIILQKKFAITPQDNSYAIYQKCNILALKMLKEFLSDVPNYWKVAEKQLGKGSYWNKPSAADYTIEANMTVKEIVHIYRSFAKLTKVNYQGKVYKVEHVETTQSHDWLPQGSQLSNKRLLNFTARDGRVMIYLQTDEKAL